MIKMSDDFIPLTQSTPVQRQPETGNNQFKLFVIKRHRGPKRVNHRSKWEKSSRSSYGSNSSNNSYSNERSSIDAYLHPEMLQDPWEILRIKQQNYSNTK